MTERRTPLEEYIEEDEDVFDTLTWWALRKVGNGADAEDIAGDVLRAAIERERAGNGWVPGGDRTALEHLGAIMPGVLANWRRGKRRKPTGPLEDEGAVRDERPNAEHVLSERSDGDQRAVLAEKLRALLAEESNALVPLGILDAAAEGIEAHREIAERIGCSVPDVRNARKRLERCAQRVIAERA